jgi:hypothetical protein
MKSENLLRSDLVTLPLMQSAAPFTRGGLVGAPVHPRFGQSNKIGKLADYGFDTARDISRMVTFVSFIISLFVALAFLRTKKSITAFAVGKAMRLQSQKMLHVPFNLFLNGWRQLAAKQCCTN